MTGTCRCGGSHHPPPLYDVDHALAELAAARLRRDELTRQQVRIADQLALHADRHFAAEELETAGRALLIGAGSLASIAEMPGTVLCNILGFAGGRLVTDGRAWQPAGDRS